MAIYDRGSSWIIRKKEFIVTFNVIEYLSKGQFHISAKGSKGNQKIVLNET